MSTNVKRILSLLLASLMLTSAVSCGADQSETSKDTSSSSGSDSTAAETEDQYLDDLPENLDFEGADIRIAHGSGGGFYVDIEEEDMSDPIVEAVWKRNNLLTERINVNIPAPAEFPGGHKQFTTEVKNSIMANSDDYDVLVGYTRFHIQLAAEGLMKNLDLINYLDFEKDYWNEKYNENLSYNDIHYWAGGDISYSYISAARGLFVNTTIWDQHYNDRLYDIVMEGNWTIDEMSKRIEGLYVDKNGDGQRDVDDFYGFISDTTSLWVNCLMFGAGTSFTKYEEPGVPMLDIDSEHNIDVFNFYHDFLYNNPDAIYDDMYAKNVDMKSFVQGKALIMNSCIGDIGDDIRNMDDTFIIVPAPKYDTVQAEYRVTQSDGFPLIGLPITANLDKLDAIGAALEGMASMGSSMVYPAYYETTLKDKYSRNPEAQELIELMHDSIIADFCLTWSESIGYMGNSTISVFSDNIHRENVVSMIEKNMKIFRKGIEMLFEDFEANSAN